MSNKIELPLIQKILLYIAAFCIILNIGCVYTHISGGGHLDGVVTFLPPVLLFLIVCLRRTFRRDSVHLAFYTATVLMVYLFILSLISGANMRNAIAEIALVVLFALYYLLVEKNEKLYC